MNNITENIIELPKVLQRNGFTYTLVLRNGNYAIYRQQVTEILNYFEVVTIRVKPESFFKGRFYPAREVFPPDEAFGYSAWTCTSLEKAIIKFTSLIR
jgi:hypothetical protein